MNDNLEYLRNKNRQAGDVEESDQSVSKMSSLNIDEEALSETQKPNDSSSKYSPED